MGARREAEDDGANLEEQPPAGGLFGPGETKVDDQVLIFKRWSRLPTWHCRSLST